MIPDELTGLAIGLGIGGIPLVVYLVMQGRTRGSKWLRAVLAVIGLAALAFLGLIFCFLYETGSIGSHFCPGWAYDIEGMKLLHESSSGGMMGYDEMAVCEIPADKLDVVLANGGVPRLKFENKGLAYENTLDRWLPVRHRKELEKSGAYLLGNDADEGTYRCTILIDRSRADVYTVYYRRSK